MIYFILYHKLQKYFDIDEEINKILYNTCLNDINDSYKKYNKYTQTALSVKLFTLRFYLFITEYLRV